MRSLLPLIFALITVAKASAGVCDFGFAEFDQGANPDVAQKALRECLLTADLEPDAKADYLSMLAVSLQSLGRTDMKFVMPVLDSRARRPRYTHSIHSEVTPLVPFPLRDGPGTCRP